VGEPEKDRARALIERFLLGTASEEERQDVERRLFAENEFAEELQGREDDLIDDYAHGRLAEPERAQFQRRWLSSPEKSERVAFALAARRLRSPRQRKSLPAWLPFAAAALLALTTSVLGWRTRELGQRLEHEQVRSAAREHELEQHLTAAQRIPERAQSTDVTVSLSLPAPAARDGAVAPELIVPKNATLVAIAVPVETTWRYVSYQVVIRTAEGVLVWEDAGLRPDAGKPLVPRLAADLLPPGDYILTLSGRRASGPASELAERYFRIVRR
jgi:hypothetical protein